MLDLVGGRFTLGNHGYQVVALLFRQSDNELPVHWILLNKIEGLSQRQNDSASSLLRERRPRRRS